MATQAAPPKSLAAGSGNSANDMVRGQPKLSRQRLAGLLPAITAPCNYGPCYLSKAIFGLQLPFALTTGAI